MRAGSTGKGLRRDSVPGNREDGRSWRGEAGSEGSEQGRLPSDLIAGKMPQMAEWRGHHGGSELGEALLRKEEGHDGA